MYHRNYTSYLNKELDFLKLLVSRFNEQEQVNDLELGVAMQKTQEIYEHFLKIKLLPNASSIEKPTATPTNTVEQPATTVIVEKKTPKKPKEEIPVITIIEEKEQPNNKKTTILAEKISPSDFHPINETLAKQKACNDLSSKLQTAPLSSIVSGIGINDKFLYIRELFKSDNNLYNSAVKHLDTVDSLEEAMSFVKKHFDWDEKNETVQKFVNLVQRRYMEN